MSDRKITIKINADGTAAIRNIREVADETRRFGDQSERTSQRAAAAFRSMAGQIGIAIGGGALARAYLDANVAADRLAASLTAVTGSSSMAGREMAYIVDTANRLGLEVNSAASAYVSLSAAAKGTTLEGARARDIFEAVSLAMTKLGKTSADTEGALLAIEQMISKGKVSAEELRNQLGERLPGAFQAAASAMGVTTVELDKMLSTGNLTADDLLPKLASRLNDLYDDGAEISGITAEWNRMTGAFQSLAVAIDNATGLTSGLQAALRAAAGSIDDVRWAIDFISQGTNPDARVAALSTGEFGYETLRSEADRLFSGIMEKQQEVARLSQQMADSNILSRSLSGLPEMLARSQGELLEMAQRLGEVKAALAEMDRAQEQVWDRQRQGAESAAQAVKDYGTAMVGETKVVADLEQQYGLLRGQLDAIWQLESSRGKTAGVDSSRMVQDLASAKGAVTEIVGEFQMARATAQGLNADLSTFEGQAEAAARYLAEAAEKGLTLWEQFAYYHGGPNRAAWGDRTKAYADAAVKIVESANGAMASLSRNTASAIDDSQVKIAQALAAAQSQVEGLISQYLPGEAAARKYAAAQSALAVASKAAGLSQAQAAEILEKMRAEMDQSATQADRDAGTWATVWEGAVKRVDDAFANLWVDLFE
ncbi:MAG: hypothetical protein EOM22_16770, partial [Gammaproteobacteria bacterium]|nr:hypothetical protein [Gammaproteobacteria bacterium]